MILLQLNINKQIIIPKINRDVVSDSVGFLYAKINLDEDWTGLKTKVVIYSENDSADILIPDNNLVEIPNNFLKEDTKLKFTISGYSDDGRKILHTKEMLSYVNVFPAGKYVGNNPESYQPELWEQAISQINIAVDAAKNVEDRANSGEFIGPQGPEGKQGKQGPEGPQGIPGSATPEFIAMVEKTEENAQRTEQAYSDFLAQLGVDIATLVGGKVPMSQIPATATQEIYTITSEAELTSLTAQRGDLAELIEEIDGERTITKTWQCLGDSSNRNNWVVWGTSYAVSSGNATTANNAENANTINNHRIIEISAEEFEAAVKDENTYYLVY